MLPSKDSPAGRFAGTVRFPTISSPESFSLDPFLELHRYSRDTWRFVSRNLTWEVAGGASLLLKWSGRDSSAQPLMLTAHQDVVPPGEGWSFDPFSGELLDGRITGRGTVDYKCGYAGMLEACEILISQGFVPERTVYLAFGHDEETGGFNGAAVIAELLEKRGVFCSSVLDEGGYVYTLPGGAEQGVVAVAEKGYASFRIIAEAVQGHSSVPPEKTAIGILARAVLLLQEADFPSPGFPPGITQVPCATTTVAPTMISGGCKENVLPGSACVTVNTRPAPGSSVKAVESRIREILAHLEARVELLRNPSLSEPSVFSSTASRDYLSLIKAVECVIGKPPCPGVFPAATDSRRYRRITGDSYGFMPVRLGEKGVSLLHSVDESIHMNDYMNCVRFYEEYIRRAAGNC